MKDPPPLVSVHISSYLLANELAYCFVLNNLLTNTQYNQCNNKHTAKAQHA